MISHRPLLFDSIGGKGGALAPPPKPGEKPPSGGERTPHPSLNGWRKRRRATPSPQGRGLSIQIDPRSPQGRALSIQIDPRCCLFLALGVLTFLLSCGYKVAGRGERLPPDIKTIAVPIFVNQSPTFRIEAKLAGSISRELLERTKFQITPNPAGADAVLKGTVKEVTRGVITFDLTTGRASSLQIQVITDVKLEDLHSHKVVYANPNFVFREQYQVSETTSGLFEEDQAALDRLSRDVARTFVTELLENF